MTKTRPVDEYSAREAQQRFEAALRGAQLVGHKPMKDIPKRNGESRVPQSKKRRKNKAI
jgi:hypothetical protein